VLSYLDGGVGAEGLLDEARVGSAVVEAATLLLLVLVLLALARARLERGPSARCPRLLLVVLVLRLLVPRAPVARRLMCPCACVRERLRISRARVCAWWAYLLRRLLVVLGGRGLLGHVGVEGDVAGDVDGLLLRLAPRLEQQRLHGQRQTLGRVWVERSACMSHTTHTAHAQGTRQARGSIWGGEGTGGLDEEGHGVLDGELPVGAEGPHLVGHERLDRLVEPFLLVQPPRSAEPRCQQLYR
jgi:hypothetical protein